MEFLYIFVATAVIAFVAMMVWRKPMILVIAIAIPVYLQFRDQLSTEFYFMAAVVIIAALIAPFATKPKDQS